MTARIGPASRPAASVGASPAGDRADALAPADYAFVADLLYREIGLALAADKEYLVYRRLAAAAATYGRGTLGGLVAALRAEHAGPPRGPRPVTLAVCDAMTTNETLFFRDGHPFDALRDVILPAAARRGSRAGRAHPVRVWCAAASTGQEPYSVAICAALASPQMGGAPVEIVATDYSARALERARAGTYTDFEVRRGLAPDLAARFFAPTPSGGLRVRDAIRRMVRFEQRNLLEPFARLGPFDVVLCRNVLFYFDDATKRDVLDRTADVLAPGGLLLLGGTESPLRVSTRLARAPGMPTPAYVAVGARAGRDAPRDPTVDASSFSRPRAATP